MDCPVPMHSEYFIEIFVTPSPPADTSLSPPLPAREQGADLHLCVIAHFAEGATRVTHPKVVDPASKYGVDLRNQHLSRGCTPSPDEIADFSLDCLAGLLLRGHQDEISIPLTFAHAAQV